MNTCTDSRKHGPGSAAALGFSITLHLDQRVCDQLEFQSTDETSYPLVALNYYPKASLNEGPLAGAVRAHGVTFSSGQMPWCLIDVTVAYEHMRSFPTRAGPVVVRLLKGVIGDAAGLHGSSLTFARKTEDAYEVGRSVGKLYFYSSPSAESTLTPAVVYNGPECESSIFVGFPTHVQLMDYWQVVAGSTPERRLGCCRCKCALQVMPVLHTGCVQVA